MSTPTVRGPANEFATSVRKPADFDQFWTDVMAESAAIPLNAEITPVPLRSTDEVETFEIHYDSIDGVRIAGWYSRPRESYIPGPYPALLLVPGYVSEPTVPKAWAKLGYAAVGVAPRGKLRSNKQYNPGYPGLLTNNITDKNTYAYRGFYVDALRAVDFVQSRPEVDSTRIGVHGGSQGGALTLVLASLRNDAITCGAAGAPYLTGFMDAASLTHSNPYEEMNDYLHEFPESEPQMRATTEYFDCINLAEKITCPMLVTIGLGDDVCPPETAYGLIGAMKQSAVELHAYARCAHDAGSYWDAAKVKVFLASHLKPAGGAK